MMERWFNIFVQNLKDLQSFLDTFFVFFQIPFSFFYNSHLFLLMSEFFNLILIRFIFIDNPI